jgi:hypothetical protein
VHRGREDEKDKHDLPGKPEGNRTLGKSKRRYEDNIKLDLEVAGQGQNSYGSVEDSAAGFCEDENEHLVSTTRMEFLKHVRKYQILKQYLIPWS